LTDIDFGIFDFTRLVEGHPEDVLNIARIAPSEMSKASKE